MIIHMAKVEIIGPKRYFFDAVGFLHHLGVLHIEDVAHRKEEETLLQPMAPEAAHSEQIKKLESLRTRINAMLATLTPTKVEPKKRESVYKEIWRENTEEMAKEIDQAIFELEQKTGSLATEKYTSEMELSTITKYEPIMEKIHPLAKQLKTYEGFESIALLVDRKYKAGLAELKEEIERITKKQCELVSADLDETTTGAILLFNKIYSKPVHDFLSLENVSQVRLPPELASVPFEEALATIKERRRFIPAELERIGNELKEISETWYLRLTTIADVLEDKIEVIKAVPKFGETAYAFVIKGWMPKKEIEKTTKMLNETFEGKVILHETKITPNEWEEAPVALSNPSWSKPFEFFYRLSGVPRYGTVDPTFFMAIFFPFIFGAIIGDVGYGLIMLLVSLWLRKKFVGRPFIQTLAGVFRLSSIGCILWGILFFEFFGNLPEKIFHHYHLHIPHFELFGVLPIPLIREKMVIPLLGLAIAIGVIHVSVGLVFGLINAILEHKSRHMFEKIGHLSIFLIGPLLIILGIATKLPLTGVGALVIVLGVGMAAYGGSVKGIIEIMGTMGNIISYARIMALGIAGAILASVSNEIAGEIGGLGGMVAMSLGIALAAFIHTINIVLHGLSASIHSMRLHLLESFTKFFEPAKIKYHPFERVKK